MRKIDQFIASEKTRYGDIFSDIMYAKSELEPFLPQAVLQQRKYTTALPILSRYMMLLDNVKNDTGKEGMLGFLKDDKHIGLLEDYKRDHEDAFKQLVKCYTCQCLKCPKECEFDSCLGCKAGASVVTCDRTQLCAVCHDEAIIPLENNSTQRVEDYEVLATMQDIKKDKRYIFLQGTQSDEKLVLYYYPGISDTTYGEITDEAEFDSVIAAYQRIEKT
ncbi:MAG: DUF1292 domain-containing protein [Hyphomonadaceae bacterium]|nr:DUF1292 domain-containing protein [Clostridia bacterium]